MTRNWHDSAQDSDDDPSRPSVFEAAAEPADPWFVPPAPEDAAWEMPGPRTAPPPVDARAWRRAEATQARGLVAAAEAFARLDERMRRAPPGRVARLAQDEAEALSRLSGARLMPGRLALHAAWAGQGTEADTRALSAAHWALRRLIAGRPPEPGDLAGFLGRIALRDAAPELAGLAPRWEALAAETALHPITRAGMCHHGWRALGLSDVGDLLEPGTAAALIGAAGAPGGMPFLPAARAGGNAHRAGGTPEDRLAAWYEGVQLACLSALMLLDRIAAWRAKAGHATADLKGRTPPILLDALAEADLMSTETAAGAAGCSRAAAERNLNLLRERGLIREMTGQSRFRLWRALP